jgi:hypothetical protein
MGTDHLVLQLIRSPSGQRHDPWAGRSAHHWLVAEVLLMDDQDLDCLTVGPAQILLCHDVLSSFYHHWTPWTALQMLPQVNRSSFIP